MTRRNARKINAREVADARKEVYDEISLLITHIKAIELSLQHKRKLFMFPISPRKRIDKQKAALHVILDNFIQFEEKAGALFKRGLKPSTHIFAIHKKIARGAYIKNYEGEKGVNALLNDLASVRACLMSAQNEL